MERVTQAPAPDIASFSTKESNFSPEKGTIRTLSAPVTIQWELTPWCNERCVHCYNYWRDPAKQDLDISPRVETFFDRATDEIINNKIFHVTLTGGEPLALYRLIYPRLERLSEKGTTLNLNSNLTMITKEKAQSLKSVGIGTILTSLISYDAEKNDRLANRPNTFSHAVRGINIALEAGLGVAVNMVVTKENIHDVYPTAKFVKSLGVKSFSATKASAPIRDINFDEYSLSQVEFKFMLNELLKVNLELGLNVDSLEFYPICSFGSQDQVDIFGGRICNAGKTACTIGFNGQIRPCSHASQEYGSICDSGGMKSAWLKMQEWRDNSLIPEKCSDCELAQMCRGGCRTEAFVSSGKLNGEDPYCTFNKHPFKKSRQEILQVSVNDLLTFTKKVKVRDEDFGAIIYRSPTKWLPVNRTLKEFYLTHKTDNFNINELAMAFGVGPTEVAPTAGVMLQTSLIERRKR